MLSERTSPRYLENRISAGRSMFIYLFIYSNKSNNYQEAERSLKLTIAAVETERKETEVRWQLTFFLIKDTEITGLEVGFFCWHN